ncbi:shikimate kinase [Kineococcus sp. SYSU DK002]|uniref:shikimate kinase n=1 Tax=Kineococcus sp. SYSU DK002 TaxID=3383123 RepID=UPI003D7CE9C8
MIVLVGFMGAGKTTTGRQLAHHLGTAFVDADEEIVHAAGRSIAEVFSTDGEAAFRDLEEDVVARLLDGPERVVSLGGGACGRARTRERLAGHTVVHLDVSYAEFRRRTAGDVDRPLLARPDLEDLHGARRAVFTDVATTTLPVDGRTVDEVVRDILEAVPAVSQTDGGPLEPEDR